jgi:hypothetical protein
VERSFALPGFSMHPASKVGGGSEPYFSLGRIPSTRVLAITIVIPAAINETTEQTSPRRCEAGI